MGDLYAYTALAGASVIGLIIPTITFLLTRAWYLGRIEDLTARLARRDRDLEAAGAVIDAAVEAGFVVADEPKGRHAR